MNEMGTQHSIPFRKLSDSVVEREETKCWYVCAGGEGGGADVR